MQVVVINLKEIALFRLVEKNVLSLEEARALNALCGKNLGFSGLVLETGLPENELFFALKSLVKKNVVKEKAGVFSAGFFEAMELLLVEKEKVAAVA